MKYNAAVSSSRRKTRKAHFTAPSNARRVIMSAPLAKDQRKKLGVRSLPIRKGDEVQVTRGHYKGKDGKVVKVYRKRYVIHIEKLTRERASQQAQQTVHIGIHPSKVVILKPELDKDRKDLIERKTRHKEADKGKMVVSPPK